MNNDGWTKVEPKKKTHKGKIVKCYWDGFDTKGNQKWFVEFSSGRVVSKGWFPK